MKRKGKTALVVEGGGMRGVFSAGILDYFLEKNFDPFDLYFGVSAGACNLASHLAGQHERNYRCYTKYMLYPEFFSIKKFLRGGHYMDLDWFWDHLAEVDPLDSKTASKKEFYVVSTDVHTGNSVCSRAENKTLFDLLKGSSALPLLFRKFVHIDGKSLIDGGVANSIPVKDAIEKGATRIMVLRSQLESYVKKSFMESKVIPVLFSKYPGLKKAMHTRETRYNEVSSFLKNPPTGVEIVQIFPSVLRTGRTTRDKAVLEADYAEGKRAGKEAIRRWK
jgi:predicted patatin/cPLA2 family phospholipase